MDSQLDHISNAIGILGKDENFDDETWISFIEEVVHLCKDYIRMETPSGFVEKVYQRLKDDGIIVDKDPNLGHMISAVIDMAKTCKNRTDEDWAFMVQSVINMHAHLNNIHPDSLSHLRNQIESELRVRGIWGI